MEAIKVLLVDDDSSYCDMTCLSLMSIDAGLDVTAVQVPEQGLSLVGEKPFDCIVSDYQMPGMNGVQLCSEIRKTSSIPFIIYTGKGSEEVASQAFSAGVDDYVRKERDLDHYEVLARRVRHAVEKKRVEKALSKSRSISEKRLDKFRTVRISGIELIGDVPWGTHFCQFYKTKQDLLDILVPYFKAGLEGNEFCMWITAEPLNGEEAVMAMKKAFPGFQRYLDNGQIEIIPYEDWYMKGGSFESSRVLQGWVDRLETALKRGFSGLRLTGNNFWLEKEQWKAFTDYEAEVNGVISQYNMIALCTYSLDKCNATEVIDVIKNHQFALIKREGEWELIEGMDRREALAAMHLSEEKYRSLFNSMTDGFALHRMIYDDVGNPIDYVFLDVNDAFTKQTGLSRDSVINNRVTQVIPGFERDPNNLIGVYGKTAMTGEPARLEIYFEPLQKWYSIYAYSPQKDHFVAIFSDGTDKKKGEETLQQSREDLNRAQAVAKTGSWRLDTRNNILTWSQETHRTFGVPLDVPMTYEFFLSRVHPDDKSYVDEKWQAALKGVRYDIEHRILVDGKVKWVREVAVLDFDYKGNMIGGFGTVSDITERKLLEEENKAHEQQLSSMNEELSASNEELRSLNDQLLKSEMELESTNRELLALSKELSRVNSELSAVNYELQTKNEECVKVNRELEESKEKIEDYADDMESLVEKQAKQVFESERRLRAFMDSSSEGFSLYDEHLNLVDANNVVVKRFPQEIRKEDIIGKNIIELYKGIEKTEWYHAYRRVLETGESYHFDAQRGVGFMSTIFLSVSAFKVGSGLGVVSRDVTRRVMAEAALREAQQSEVMERMSAMVAHDIRNPLNIVSQAATTIQSHPERSDRMIELIKNNIERALKMIDDLRYSTRKLSPKLRMTDLSNLVIGAGEEASLNPSVNVSYDLMGVVNLAVDPDLMHRVLDNLVKNAVEVMPNGGTLTFGTRIDDRYAVITVSDTGPGIPEEIQKSLFDPLVTTKKDGLGLGLHFCKRVIEAHGGSLTYTTRIGEGTTFSVRLPIMAQ